MHHPTLPADAARRPPSCASTSCAETPGLRKKPGTSELIDWLFVLIRAGCGPAAEVARNLPFLGVLLKQEQ